jgi:prepilin-type N-terminal cleavage/methylation domain-containing protein
MMIVHAGWQPPQVDGFISVFSVPSVAIIERESIMKTARIKNGFTILELLMSLVILAVLMTAVAVAFDASIVNFKANEGISKTTNAARAALLRMTTELRTAQGVGVIGSDDPDNTQCSLTALNPDGSTRNITYRFDADDHALYLDADGNSYALCKNVTAASFNRAAVPGNPSNIRNVRIVLTLTDDKGNNSQTLAAAAVVRRNLN